MVKGSLQLPSLFDQVSLNKISVMDLNVICGQNIYKGMGSKGIA